PRLASASVEQNYSRGVVAGRDCEAFLLRLLLLLLSANRHGQGEQQARARNAPRRPHPSPPAAKARRLRGRGSSRKRNGRLTAHSFDGVFVRLRWLRWQCVAGRGRERVLGLALPVCGFGNPSVAVLPHIGERVFQFRKLRLEQLRDAIWRAVLVRCRLHWWQWRAEILLYFGVDLTAAAFITRCTCFTRRCLRARESCCVRTG